MKRIVSVIAMVVAVLVAGTQLASAHVVVTPEAAAPAERVTFSVSVPNEKEVAVTELRVLVPAGLKSVTPTVHPGWTITTAKEGDTVTEITWKGGEIPAGQRDDFTFRAQAPEKEGDIQWKAYQTYADGSIASWDQAPSGDGHGGEDSDKGPYSVTKISESSSAVASAESGTDNDYILPLATSLIALITSIVALQRSGRRKA